MMWRLIKINTLFIYLIFFYDLHKKNLKRQIEGCSMTCKIPWDAAEWLKESATQREPSERRGITDKWGWQEGEGWWYPPPRSWFSLSNSSSILKCGVRENPNQLLILTHFFTHTHTAYSFLKKTIPTNKTAQTYTVTPPQIFLSPPKSELLVVCIYLSMQVFGMLDFELKLQSLLWLGTWDGVEKNFFFFPFLFSPLWRCIIVIKDAGLKREKNKMHNEIFTIY